MRFPWPSRQAIVFGIVVEGVSLALLTLADWILTQNHHSPDFRTEWFAVPLTIGLLLNLFGFDVGVVFMIAANLLGVPDNENLWVSCYGIIIASSAMFWAWSYDYWKRPRAKHYKARVASPSNKKRGIV